MKRSSWSLAFVVLSVTALIILSADIEGTNGGPGSDWREYDCGGSCHTTESQATTISMAASNLNPSPGETITVTVTVTGAEASGTPLGVFLVRSQTVTNSMPSVDGWVILSDPSGVTNYNYYEEKSVTGGVVWTWTLQAPSTAGTYQLYAREHHGTNGKKYFRDDSVGLTFTIIVPDNPPTFFLTAPGAAPGESYPQGSLVTVTWAAADDNPWPAGGNVVNLSYGPTPAGGTPIATLQNVGGSYSWDTTPVAPGTYYVSGSVFDSSGQAATDASNNSFTITVVDANPPAITSVLADPDPTELGAVTNLSATITDDTLVDPATVSAEVTYPSTTVSNLSMQASGDLYWVEQAFPELGAYTFTIWAADTSGNWASASGGFQVEDTTPPALTATSAVPSPQGVGGYVNVSSMITDVDSVAVATVDVTDPLGTPLFNTTMNLDPGTGRSYWNATYVTTGVYDFTIWASDPTGNWGSDGGTFEIKGDPVPPVIADVTVDPPSQALGGAVNVSANVTDDVAVGGVWIDLTDPGGAPFLNATMAYDAASGRYYYNATYAVPGTWSFILSANDTSDNWATSAGSFMITESVPPAITDLLVEPPVQELGGVVNVSANITDNVAVDGAWLLVLRPDATLLGNFTMAYDIPAGRYWLGQPYFDLGTHAFTIWSSDASGNWANLSGSFDIVDTTPPVITHTPVAAAELGVAIPIAADVTDLGVLDAVRLHYVDVGGTAYVTLDMAPAGGDTYAASIPAQVQVGEVRYYIEANDTAGNGAREPSAGYHPVLIVDSQPPSVTNVAADPPSVLPGEETTLTAQVSDPAGVAEVYAFVFGPGTAGGAYAASYDSTSGTYQVPVQFSVPGQYNFTFWAQDASGNWGSSEGTFEVSSPVPKKPSPPANLATMTVDGESILITWTPPTTYEDATPLDPEDVLGYSVYRSSAPGGTFAEITTEPARGTLFLDDTALAGETYYYRVTAVTTDGQESDPSSAVEGRISEGPSPQGADWLPWILVAILAILEVATVVLLLWRRTPPGGEGAPVEQEVIVPPEEELER
jgi:hypothetical protein